MPFAKTACFKFELAGRREGESEDGDVVLLAEGLCGLRLASRRLGGDRSGAVEAEELAGLVAGFNHAVGFPWTLLTLELRTGPGGDRHGAGSILRGMERL